jgi:hypothetical protein
MRHIPSCAYCVMTQAAPCRKVICSFNLKQHVSHALRQRSPWLAAAPTARRQGWGSGAILQQIGTQYFSHYNPAAATLENQPCFNRMPSSHMTLPGFHFLSKLQNPCPVPIHSCRLESHSNASNVDVSCHIDARYGC